MFRAFIRIAAFLCLAYLIGCGGGGSGGGKTSVFVRILATKFSPKYATIVPGGQVQWTNQDSNPHQIVSGTLDAQGSPLVIYTIDITLTGFNPTALTADLGNTIMFNNLSGVAFIMDIVDDNGTVSTVSFAIGEMKTVKFSGAGMYTFRQHASQIFQGTLILYGQPNPNGMFKSPVLPNGQSFIVQLNSSGNYSYYDLDQTNPNQSFRTGIITVQ